MQKTLILKKYIIKDGTRSTQHSTKELSLFQGKQPSAGSYAEAATLDSAPQPSRPFVPPLGTKMRSIVLLKKGTKDEVRRISISMIPKDLQSLSEYKYPLLPPVSRRAYEDKRSHMVAQSQLPYMFLEGTKRGYTPQHRNVHFAQQKGIGVHEHRRYGRRAAAERLQRLERGTSHHHDC